ncbi:MAG TPA: HD domain-containing phosphohydrolase [Bdellovibrionota bacterium]|nr:HD domain-containing phosphohydrolase [Bdellovibrionota bacterium]
MIKYGGYHRIPKFLLKPGAVLEVDLHLFLPANDTILCFRRKGDPLSTDDSRKLTSIADENLLCMDAERAELTAWIGKAMGTRIDESLLPGDPIDPEALTTAAGALVGMFHPRFESRTLEDGTAPENSKLLNEAADLVEQIVSQLKNTRSAAAYSELLQQARASGSDPLISHERQVSALAVIVLMNSESASMDDLSDLGTAGLVHDLGLNEITRDLRDRHLSGQESNFTVPEKLIYLRHPELALDKLKERKIKISPSVSQIILQHHENWDGSGFKGVKWENICRGARALRIADELVAWMSNSANSGGLVEAFAEVSKSKDVLDPVLLKALGASLKS